MDVVGSICLSVPIFAVDCCPLPRKRRYILATEKKKHFFFAEHAKNLIAFPVATHRIAGETIACENI